VVGLLFACVPRPDVRPELTLTSDSAVFVQWAPPSVDRM